MISSLAALPDTCREAFDYAYQIQFGEIPAGKLIKLAVKRFFADIKRSEETDWPYRLDYEKANRAIQFVRMMPHIKGPEAGQPLELAGWQKWIYLQTFGWVRKDTGNRRFRKVYTEIPRGNGKSTMVAPAALYMLAADGEGGAEVYSAGVVRDQARIVFGAAQAMARKRKAFLKRAGVEIFAHSIAQDETNSVFQPLSSDARTLDGLNVHFAVLDELAQHKRREVHDVIETALGKRLQPLLWLITTAGPDQSGIGFEVHSYGKKVAEGSVQDDSFLSVIYNIDPEDDWTQPESWRKANPNWQISVRSDSIEQLANRAIQVPSFQNAFRIKHLNQWVNAAEAWVDSIVWSKQAVPADEEDFLGEECMIGLDLAAKVDIAAAVKVFRRPYTGDIGKHKWQYTIIPKFYLPEGAVKASRNASYEGWAIGNHIVVTPGDAIDFGYIQEDLREDCQRFNVVEIPFDPWQATQMAQNLMAEGIPMVEFPATVRNFSEPMKEFEALLRQSLLFHSNSPVMNWMVGNVTAIEDRKGNIFPRKQANNEAAKIDGVVAGIMALARWMFKDMTPTKGSILEDSEREVYM